MAHTADVAPPHILVILGSARDHRFGPTVAHWFMRQTEHRTDLTFELADLREWQFHYFNRAKPAASSDYEDDDEAKRWAEVVGRADGFVIISPEYNYGYPAVLKSALDSVYAEWNRKPVSFVSYGGWSGGVRAMQQLREVAVELQLAPVRTSVVMQFAPRLFNAEGELKEPQMLDQQVTRLLDDLSWWAYALRAARQAV
ncbi:MAG: NADPH-dependent FMN reductase [Candidatus Dormibacteria bacterium]